MIQQLKPDVHLCKKEKKLGLEDHTYVLGHDMSEAILELGAFCVLDAMMLMVPASMIFSILLNVTAWPPTFFLRSKINKQGGPDLKHV